MSQTDARPEMALPHAAERELHAESVPGWRRHALCASVDPDAWFPEHGVGADTRVLRLCAECPVRRSCLATALLGHDLGVWAGTTELTRRPGHRMLRHDVPAAKVVDVLLDRADRKASRSKRRGGNRWSGSTQSRLGGESAA
jgi:hypothetical protein